MIFVTVGSCMKFTRLLGKMSELAPLLDEEVIMQTGQDDFQYPNCRCFTFEPSISKYYAEARLIISHGGFSTLEIIKTGKSLLVVPRQKEFAEHYDNHQVEFAELLHKKLGIKYLTNINTLTPELIKNYDYVVEFNNENLLNFRKKALTDLNNI